MLLTFLGTRPFKSPHQITGTTPNSPKFSPRKTVEQVVTSAGKVARKCVSWGEKVQLRNQVSHSGDSQMAE